MGSKHNGDKRHGEEVEEEDSATDDRRQSKRLKLTDSKPFQDLIYDDTRSGPPSPVSFINNDVRNKPAEVYRKDLISAMKLPDSHMLSFGTFLCLEDHWRQEWERGVQVPVNPEGLQVPSFRPCFSQSPQKPKNFKLPSKLITKKVPNSRTREPALVPYDLDEMDTEWLKFVNRTRHNRGLPEVSELSMEKMMSYFENKCYDNMCIALATKKDLSREFDENVCCDICQSPDVEENNEIIFCDSCDIGVHQACYGVQSIPFGSWLCRPCSRALRPSCVLCPNKGGAMKKTKDGKQWCHVSCALWIPEVGVGTVEKMEPITRINNIPASRWNLVCFLCREKLGACIQCSVKTCITAFHVTCGFQHGLPMRTILDDNATDGVRHVCYCARHSNRMKSPAKEKPKEHADQPEENIRDKKLREMEEEFYKYVDINDAVKDLNITKELAIRIHAFWTHKRKVRDDVPLLPPTAEQQERLTGQKGLPNSTDQSNEMERFVLLRQDLERVRNLCYMVNKREKMRRELWRARELVFRKQVEILTDDTLDLSEEDLRGIIKSSKGNFFNDDSDDAGGSSGGSLYLQALTSASCSLSSSPDSSGNATSDSNGGSSVRGNQAATLPNGLLMEKNNVHLKKKRRRHSGFIGKRQRRRQNSNHTSQTSSSPGQIPGSPSQTPGSPSQTPCSPGQTPGSPGQTPASPGQTPGSPGQTPASPGQTPASPGQTPVTPSQTPGTPSQTSVRDSQLPVTCQTPLRASQTPSTSGQAATIASPLENAEIDENKVVDGSSENNLDDFSVVNCDSQGNAVTVEDTCVESVLVGESDVKDEPITELKIDNKCWQKRLLSKEFGHNDMKVSLEMLTTRRSRRLLQSDDASTSLGNDSSSAAESDTEVKEKIHEVRQLRNRLRDSYLTVSSLQPSRHQRTDYLSHNKESVSETTRNKPRTTYELSKKLQKNNLTVSKQSCEGVNPRRVKRSLGFERKSTECKPRITISPYLSRRRIQRTSTIHSNRLESSRSKQSCKQSIQSSITQFLNHEDKLLSNSGITDAADECYSSQQQSDCSSDILSSPERTARMSSLRSSSLSRDENAFMLSENLPPGIANLGESTLSPRRRTRSQTSTSSPQHPQSLSRSSSVLNEICHSSIS